MFLYLYIYGVILKSSMYVFYSQLKNIILIEVFSPFILNVITDVYEFKHIFQNLLSICPITCFFSFLSPFLPSFRVSNIFILLILLLLGF